MAEIARQRDVIARIQPKQAQDTASIAAWVDKTKDAGNAAYYSFHATWDTPAPLAFAARRANETQDVVPAVLSLQPVDGRGRACRPPAHVDVLIQPAPPDDAPT